MVSVQRGTNLRPVTEGAMLTALTVVLCLAGIYIPVIGGVLKFIWPVPIAVLVLRHGLRAGVMATVVSGLLLFMLTGPINALITMAGFGLIGVILGYTLRSNLSAPQVILWCAVGSAVSIIASLYLAGFVIGVNPIDAMIEAQQLAIEQMRPLTQQLYGADGGPAAQQMEEMLAQFPQLMRMILPAVVVVAAVFSSFMNFLVAGWVLRRMGSQVVSLPPFAMWRFPMWCVYVYLAGLGLSVVGDFAGVDFARPLGINLLTAFGYLFLVGGVSLAVYFFKRSHVSRSIKIGIGVLIFVFFAYVFQLLVYVGIFDSIFNYRARLEKMEEAKRNDYTGGDSL